MTSTQLLLGPTSGHDPVGHVDGFDGGDHGDDAGVGFDLDRICPAVVDDHEGKGKSEHASGYRNKYLHELTSQD